MQHLFNYLINFIIKLDQVLIIKVKMQIIQRNHNYRQENAPKSKILEKYKNHIEQMIQNSELSFDSMQTPGWTSLVNTQQSKPMHHNHIKKPFQSQCKDFHKQILNRLNSLPKLNENLTVYPKIRLNSSLTKNKNIIVYGSAKNQQKRNNQTPKSKIQNKFLNRFNKGISKPLLTIEKVTDSNKKNSNRKRISSVRSQTNDSLKQKIKQRLSVGNPNISKFYSESENKLFTQGNQNINQRSQNFQSPSNFFSRSPSKIDKNESIKSSKKNYDLYSVKQQGHQYLNRYLNKLHQRSLSLSSAKMLRKKQILTNKQNKQNTGSKCHKRFNTISIHYHLYKESIKLQSKKNIEKLIDQSYLKTHTLTFTPQISQKSNLLAQSKFLRQNNGQMCSQFKSHCAEKCFKKVGKQNVINQFSSNISIINQKIISKQKQKMSQKLQNRTFSKLFSILSNNQKRVNQKTLQINIQKFPLSLLQLLEPILTKIYNKISYSQKQFIELFFSSNQNHMKQISSKRNLIVSQSQKFFKIFTKQIQQKNMEKQNIIKNSNN